ncbi:hypothetical protein GH714_026252 [Hevea brasiliensis]|uniref:Zinc knuckle CX2CX4HX4C domain-containing protein n=1 Tax=Hevea brasiliensis TaxID=3981 RepID=A0A6A6MPS9_HEVBR|nr:hypothetical protein GH714_026252 [Hevea brasiliensis]
MDEEEYELVVEAAIVHNEIEVRDLPIGFHSEAVATQLGNFISQFSDYDMRVDMGSCRNFMSIRVSGDVRKPLKRWKKLRRSGQEWFLVKFRYECLTTFCFLCGCLGNSEQFCHILFSGDVSSVQRGWGYWLKTAMRQPSLAGDKWL